MQTKKQSGFTLIELMIVIAILGILAAIGVPAYNSYLMKARLEEAHINVAALKLAEEEFFLENNAYFIENTTTLLETASLGLWKATKGSDDNINFDYEVTGNNTSYTITATGIAGTRVAGKTVTLTSE